MMTYRELKSGIYDAISTDGLTLTGNHCTVSKGRHPDGYLKFVVKAIKPEDDAEYTCYPIYADTAALIFLAIEGSDTVTKLLESKVQL